MNVDFNSEGIIADIMNEISHMENLTEAEEKSAMRKIGKEIAKNAAKLLPRTSEDHVHMKDDIKVTVKSDKGIVSCIISGGKQTAYKWHMLDDGTRNKDGSVHTRALHFTDRALALSEKDIDTILAEVERKAVQHD